MRKIVKAVNSIAIIFFISVVSMPVNVLAKSFYRGSYGTITASGTGTVKIKPSGSRLYVAVSIFNKSHESAYKNLIKTISNITSRLKNNKAVKLIKTTQINISPNKIYSKHKWITNGYNAAENLIIKIHGNKNTNNAVLYLLKCKSAQINRIVPTIANMERFKIKAVKLAYKHAVSKIKAVLKLIGIKSYTVKTVNIKNTTQRVFPVPVMMRANMANTAKKIYFQGKNKITAQVFVKIDYIDNK